MVQNRMRAAFNRSHWTALSSPGRLWNENPDFCELSSFYSSIISEWQWIYSVVFTSLFHPAMLCAEWHSNKQVASAIILDVWIQFIESRAPCAQTIATRIRFFLFCFFQYTVFVSFCMRGKIFLSSTLALMWGINQNGVVHRLNFNPTKSNPNDIEENWRAWIDTSGQKARNELNIYGT